MMSNTKTEQIICYKYLQRERYEVAVTLVGVNGLRSESKSQEAATFEYAQMKMILIVLIP